MSLVESAGGASAGSAAPELLLRDGVLADGSRVDLLLRQGRVACIAPAVEAPGVPVERLDGQLVLPPFVDLHTHLDKALTLDLAENISGTLEEAIHCYGALLPGLTRENRVERALTTLRLCLAAGTTAVRSHVNVEIPDGEPSRALLAVEALLEVRERVRDVLDLQLVLLPSGNLSRDTTLREACEEALRLGVDVVGGCPALDSEPQSAIEGAFDLALRFDRDLDLHVDESDDPTVCTLAPIARLALERGYGGRVTAGHCCSLAAMDDATAGRVIEQVAAARITVVTLPSCNLYLGGRRDRHPIRRGLTRVKELMAAGVNVVAASDNIRDPFNPFGRGDLLHIADLLAHAAHLGSPAEQARALDTIGANARAVFTAADPAPLRGGLVREGDAADLVVLAIDSPAMLIAAQPARALVLHHGRVVARTRVEQDVAL